jgi:hypothetical protein
LAPAGNGGSWLNIGDLYELLVLTPEDHGFHDSHSSARAQERPE